MGWFVLDDFRNRLGRAQESRGLFWKTFGFVLDGHKSRAVCFGRLSDSLLTSSDVAL